MKIAQVFMKSNKKIFKESKFSIIQINFQITVYFSFEDTQNVCCPQDNIQKRSNASKLIHEHVKSFFAISKLRKERITFRRRRKKKKKKKTTPRKRGRTMMAL